MFGDRPLPVLIGAALVGGTVGIGSVIATPPGRAVAADTVEAVAVKTGLQRARAPQAGDFWPGCNAARAAGTAPIYRDEPGYRPEMDGDDDGVACEPYTGGGGGGFSHVRRFRRSRRR